MASCDVQSLLNSAACFDCLSNGEKETVKLQLLCEILAVTGKWVPPQSYTTAQLEAMSAGEAAAVRIAYASDALNVAGVYGTTGTIAFWNGKFWADTNFGAQIATTYSRFALNVRRQYGGNSYIAGASWNACGTVTVSATSGTGSSNGAAKTPSTGGINELISSTGTTSAGVGGFRSYLFPTSSVNALSRAHSATHNHVTIDQSTGGDTFHARFTIETGGATAAPAVQTDMVGLVYDPSNILGFGSANDNWKALIRGNSTNVSWVDTGIARTTPHWQIATFIPLSSSTAYCEVATALNDGASFTVHASSVITFAASDVCMTHYIAKATGTNAKTWNRQMQPAGLLWRVNNTTPSNYVF